jgi:hypothetical protein
MIINISILLPDPSLTPETKDSSAPVPWNLRQMRLKTTNSFNIATRTLSSSHMVMLGTNHA